MVFYISLEKVVLYISHYSYHDPRPLQLFHLPSENVLQGGEFQSVQRSLAQFNILLMNNDVLISICCIDNLAQLRVFLLPSLDAFVSTHFPKNRNTFGSPG